MFKIIDRTLTALSVNEVSPSKEELFHMCELISRLGVDYIEVSVPVLERMGQLPVGPKYILHINDIEEMSQYPQFQRYVWKSKESKNSPGLVHEIQVNDTREINTLSRFSDLQNIRITGLDEMLCVDYKESMKQLKKIFKSPIDLCPQDSYFCATALAIEWLVNGGECVTVSFNGIGGFAKLEEVMMGVKVILHKKVNVKLEVLPELTALYEKVTGTKIHYNKAIVGKNIFNVEAGIHADGINKNPLTYEPYDPKTVGKVRKLVIGKHSGTNAIKIKLKELDIKVCEQMVPILLQQVQEESIKKHRSLTDKEFLHIAEEVRGDEDKMLYC